VSVTAICSLHVTFPRIIKCTKYEDVKLGLVLLTLISNNGMEFKLFFSDFEVARQIHQAFELMELRQLAAEKKELTISEVPSEPHPDPQMEAADVEA
jgi:hypothetical protein